MAFLFAGANMTIELPKPIAVTPVPNVRYREFTKCGQKPLAGGQIWTYDANSTTLKATYKDPYGMSPNTNPIILDAAGEADIYLNGTYRFVVKDRNGVVQKDISKIGSWYSGDLDDQLKSVNDLLESSAQTLMQPLQDAIAAAAAAGAGAEGWNDLLVVNAENETIRTSTSTQVESISKMLTLKKWDGRVVDVLSYYAPNYSNPVIPVTEGGGQFRYVAALATINDGGVCINGWLRLKATYNYLTPEMFGAKGIGAAYDDQVPIQNMLNAGARGCTFDFDGAKTYYNAFKIDDATKYVDHYNAASNSRQWIRKLGATFNFNGCKFLRRKPTGDIEDVPFKTKYSDNDSSLLLIKGAENVYFNNGNFDSAATLGTFVDTSNNYIASTENLYYVAPVGTHGIRLNNCKNVFFNNMIVEKAYFNIFVDMSENVFGNVITNYSIQCPIRTYAPNDMNLGAGLKVWFSRNIKMNVTGKYNANATAEIEKFNYDVEINGGSEYDYSNGMVIQSTKGVRFDWTSKKVKGGTALLIMDTGTGAADDYCSDIRGKLTSYDVAYCGLYIIMSENCTQDFYGIEIDLQSEISSYAGLNIVNKSVNKVIKGCKIHHWSHNDNGTMKSRVFEGAMTGDVKGGSSNTDYGLFIRGTNTKETCLRFELDLRECAVPWVIAPTAIAEFNNTITPTNAFFIAANLTQNFGSADLGMTYNKRGAVYFNQDVMHSKAAYTVLDNLNNAHGSEKFRLFYDPASGASTTGGTTFPVKVFIPT